MKDNVLKGIAAAPGISIAAANRYYRESEIILHDDINDIDEAIENLKFAIDKSRKELKKVFGLAVDKLGKKRAAILEAQIMILDDQILIDTLFARLENERKLPEFIVHDEISKYQRLMIDSDEQFMKERSLDIEDIKNRIIKNLKKKKWKSRITSEVIVVTENLSPADTLLFSREKVKGYITDFGGLTSHTAIFSRSLNIPAVVGVHDATSRIQDGDLLIIDGFHGEIVINPDEEQLKYYKNKIAKLSGLDKELSKLKNKRAVTKDKHEIQVVGNLDYVEEIDIIIQNGGRGLGLVRTEQLFSQSDQFPDEDEQFKVYSKLAEIIYPHTVTIRTFDIGGDKVLPIDVQEPNPMLGWRGIRFLLDNQSLFKNQIKAILRAGAHKNIQMMIPMVSTISEIRKTKALIEECKTELSNDKIQFDKDLKIGIMVEVPSAAIMIYDFAEEVDFVSIGTNDLVQYMLAVDRGNEIVSDQYLEYHPSVIRTLAFIVKEAKRAKVPVSLCGELAAEIKAVPLLLGMGLDSLSVSGSVIPILKRVVRKINYSESVELTEKVLKVKTDAETKDLIDQFVKTHFDEELDFAN